MPGRHLLPGGQPFKAEIDVAKLRGAEPVATGRYLPFGNLEARLATYTLNMLQQCNERAKQAIEDYLSIANLGTDC